MNEKNGTNHISQSIIHTNSIEMFEQQKEQVNHLNMNHHEDNHFAVSNLISTLK